MELMGARVITIKRFKHYHTGFPFVLVYNRGKVLRHANLRREVRIGKCFVDFANDIFWIIEIDGSPWHQDVVADFDREVYLREFLYRQRQDLRILRIPAPRLWHDRARVQRDVLRFLNS